jgi:hypothetical protein
MPCGAREDDTARQRAGEVLLSAQTVYNNRSRAIAWDLCHNLRERVMGFEPTTFCLGSRHSAN